MRCLIGLPDGCDGGFYVHKDVDNTYFVRVASEKVRVRDDLVRTLRTAYNSALLFLENADVDRSNGLTLIPEATKSDVGLVLMGDITTGTWTTDEVLLTSSIMRDHGEEQWMLGIVQPDSGISLTEQRVRQEFARAPKGFRGFIEVLTGQIPLVDVPYETGRTYYFGGGDSLTHMFGSWDNGGHPVPDPTL